MKVTKNMFCSIENCKLLKELGFIDIVDYLYCTDVKHKNKSISFEEELDLKDEGKTNEIEYVTYGKIISLTNSNAESYGDAISAPTIFEAVDWLRRVHNIYVTVIPEYHHFFKKTLYGTNTYYFDTKEEEYLKLLTPNLQESFEGEMNYAIQKSLEYIKSLKENNEQK